VTVGTPAENQAFVAAFEAALEGWRTHVSPAAC